MPVPTSYCTKYGRYGAVPSCRDSTCSSVASNNSSIFVITLSSKSISNMSDESLMPDLPGPPTWTISYFEKLTVPVKLFFNNSNINFSQTLLTSCGIWTWHIECTKSLQRMIKVYQADGNPSTWWEYGLTAFTRRIPW